MTRTWQNYRNILIILVLFPLFLKAQIMPSDDAYVRGGSNDDTNYGSSSELIVKRGSVSSFFRKTLVRFDLTNVDGISDSDSAIVKLFASSIGANYDVSVYEIEDDWNEETVTWSLAPTSGNQIGKTYVDASDNYYDWEITDYFQSQLASGDSVISLAFFDDNSNNEKIVFNSKEAGSDPPLLIVKGQSSVSLDLSKVSMNSEFIPEFDNLQSEYEIDLPYSTDSIPTISAIPVNEEVLLNIKNATSISGSEKERTAQITVTAPDSSQEKVFSFEFNLLPKLDLFLLIGQSNMAGRGYIEDQDTARIESAYLAKTQNNWEVARNPLNQYSNIRKELSLQRLGPGYTFVRTLSDTMPQKHFGLVVNARGGTSISSWLEESYYGYYENTMERIKPALRYGDLKAILWLQGSSDQSHADTYLEKLETLVGDLRNDLENEELYFVCSQIGKWRSSSEEINAVFTEVPDEISYTDYINSDGLTPLNGDTTDPHFDSRSQRLLGERYADKILSAVYPSEVSIDCETENVISNYVTVENYPNPFNPTTTIEYHLPARTQVELSIFNLSGEKVKALINKVRNKGVHKTVWNAAELPSGIYFYALKTKNRTIANKCVLIK